MKIIYILRQIIDTKFPVIARNYRLIRDSIKYYSYRPYATKFGFKLYGDKNFDISREISGEVEILRKYLTSEMVFVDVGANVGFFSCFAHTLGCYVIAIEPNPLNFKLLCRNLYINGMKDIEAIFMALGDTCEIKPLYGGGQGASLIKGWGNIRSTYVNLVASTTLDKITRSFSDKSLFIKIDVEGAEYYVLKGAQKTIMNFNSLWLIENSLTENYVDLNPHFNNIFEIFWSKGYNSYSLALKRTIDEKDVNLWINRRSAGNGNINFFFFHPSKYNLLI